jgi:hypothetical protein
MATTTRLLTTAVCVLALTGCGAGGSDDPATTAPPAAAPSTPAADPTTPAAPDTEVPSTALLPDAAWAPVTGTRQDSEGITDWLLPESCAAGIASTAAAMRSTTIGDGEFEAQIGVQQVAVFPDVDAAVAEADRIAAVLAGCAAAPGTETSYLVEPLAVGAQGLGLATDYYGTSAAGTVDDDAMGSYLALTRRGTALTLIGLEGGESTIGVARAAVAGHAQAAWDLLCAYADAGC